MSEFDLPKGTRQVAHARPEYCIGQKVGAARDELALEIPAVNCTWTEAYTSRRRRLGRRGVPRASDNVEVVQLLLSVMSTSYS